MVSKLFIVALLPIVSFGLHWLIRLEVDPADLTCHHQKQIKGDPESLFEFLTSPHALEKLLPWLLRFKEADKRIISAGKSYTAIIAIPVLGERRVYATLTDYKPAKLLTFEFSDDFLKQRIVIQTRSYHDRTLLQTTIYFRRTSLIYQYTIGYALRMFMKNQLKKSMKNLAVVFEKFDGLNTIPDFSKNNT